MMSVVPAHIREHWKSNAQYVVKSVQFNASEDSAAYQHITTSRLLIVASPLINQASIIIWAIRREPLCKLAVFLMALQA